MNTTWTIPTDIKVVKEPYDILQDFANSLTFQTQGKLAGQVTESLTYENEDKLKAVYALHIYITRLKQSYRLFEIEQTSETPYPVNLKVYYYTKNDFFEKIQTPDALSEKISELIISQNVTNLLTHFLSLSELKEYTLQLYVMRETKETPVVFFKEGSEKLIVTTFKSNIKGLQLVLLNVNGNMLKVPMPIIDEQPTIVDDISPYDYMKLIYDSTDKEYIIPVLVS